MDALPINQSPANALLRVDELLLKFDKLIHELSHASRFVMQTNATYDARRLWRFRRIAYFTALYRIVTRAVRAELVKREDANLLADLTIDFANRFLNAVEAFLREQNAPELLTAPWRSALTATGRRNRLIVQHLLAGATAHILFDLGISIEKVADRNQRNVEDVFELYGVMGRVLVELIEPIQAALNSRSLLFEITDRFMGVLDTQLARFTLYGMRYDALQLALKLQFERGRPSVADEVIRKASDGTVGQVESFVDPSGKLWSITLILYRLFERQGIKGTVAAMDQSVQGFAGQDVEASESAATTKSDSALPKP